MDPISTAFSVVQGIIAAVGKAQSMGLLGGTSDWLAHADDAMTVLGNFRQFVVDSIRNPTLYDQLTAAQIRERLVPEGWAAKEARLHAELERLG